MSSNKSSTSSYNSEEEDEKERQHTFGTLLSLDTASITALALRVRGQVDGYATSEKSMMSTLNGSYNLVHIVQFADELKYVIRLPSVGWGDRLTALAREAFRSEVLTMRYIAEHTQIPVPRVFDFDASMENEIGAPFIAMSFIPGCTAASIWRDDKALVPDERRGRILDTVAQASSQLEQLRFDEIGCLHFEEGHIKVGPWYDFDLESGTTQAIGPFKSTKEYVNHHLQLSLDPEATKTGLISEKITKMAVSYLPTPRNGRETFALTIPDFNYQNIMVDDLGNLTGIIDWDGVQTLPDILGPCGYPSWLTRDWDPLMYGWPEIGNEDSPQLLNQYRLRYHDQIRRTRRCTNESLAHKSHIFEAVFLAASSMVLRMEIALKLMGRVLRLDPDARHEVEVDACRGAQLDFLGDWAYGRLSEREIRRFEKGLKALLSIPRS